MAKAKSAAKPKKKENGYQELIKSFSRVRSYMQYFYIYGFLNRDEIRCASVRTYDNEHRRVRGWMGKHYDFREVDSKRVCFISFDSRNVRRNPLYRALKSRSFTDKSIVLHFMIFDQLRDGGEHRIQELLQGCTERLENARDAYDFVFDENTLRGKLREYKAQGMLTTRKKGRDVLCRMQAPPALAQLAPALAFFSETAPCGVIGSFLEDRLAEPCESFRMKHHYIAQTFDSEMLHKLLVAMHAHQEVEIRHMKIGSVTDAKVKRNPVPKPQTVLPLFILRSAQDGRVYLASWERVSGSFLTCRLDRISAVKPIAIPAAQKNTRAAEYEQLREAYRALRENIWGVSHNGRAPVHVEFTIVKDEKEVYIRQRMERECRNARVEELEGGRLLRCSIDLLDPAEIMPWVYSFTGRIVSFSCTSRPDDEQLTGGVAERMNNRFHDDLAELALMYGLDEQEEEVQG